jgi:hypothetical protein
LLTAALGTLVLVGMLVAVLDAGVRRAAGFGTATGLESARRLHRTGRREGTAAGLFSTAGGLGGGAGGIEVTTVMAEAGFGGRDSGERKRGGEAADEKQPTHGRRLLVAVTGGTAAGVAETVRG